MFVSSWRWCGAEAFSAPAIGWTPTSPPSAGGYKIWKTGWGCAFSASRLFRDRWNPFFRAGWADGGGAAVDRSIGAGIGCRVNDGQDYLGFGAGWGRAPKEVTGGRNRDQYSFEIYYRWQPTPQLQITPDLQFILDPALNPDASDEWLAGLRVRAVF